jgi:hypothetical protein
VIATVASVVCVIAICASRAAADGGGWNDRYDQPPPTCPDGFANLGLLDDDCAADDPGTPYAGMFGWNSLQFLRVALPHGIEGSAFSYFGPRVYGRWGHLALGAQVTLVTFPPGQPQLGVLMGALSAGYTLRVGWLAPYAMLNGGGGMLFYQPTTQTAQARCGLSFLSAEAGLRVFVTPRFFLGVDGQHSLLANHSFGMLGLTFGGEGP